MKTRLQFFLAITLLTVTRSLHAQSTPSIIFTNPTPAPFEYFGNAVAAVGTDKVIIGAIQEGALFGGAAYLYSTNGTLLTTFFNPTVEIGEEFGNVVTAVGTDRVLIASRSDKTNGGSGAVYLYTTNGTLLTTFTNPPPTTGDRIGYAVVAVGTDRVIIGDIGEDTGALQAGAAYLFLTNGALLTTFLNPNPTLNASFGTAVAAVGTDRLLIGAPSSSVGAPGAGAAYLFGTNGIFNTNKTPLITFTNPTPFGGDEFGIAVAVVGSDKVLIGARKDDAGAMDAGAAHLFSTNGTLLITFTNPAPTALGHFGFAVAAVDTDKVLIGAYGNSNGAAGAGAAYLFGTNGSLLTVFTNPTPATAEDFGYAVTAVSRDKVLIGTRQDNAGATATGAAYLYKIGPVLDYSQPNPNTLIFTWPVAWTGFTLQFNTNLSTTTWVDVTDAVTVVGNTYQVTVTTTAPAANFRLNNP